ncbi:MAG TPA: DUF1552 domain-containing protein [Gammaproteobacteria bacterium]|nr:DUF1552 domain-containing protein [Gammaproteobacteria bacterium]
MKYLTGKSVSRRQVLRGAGIALSLPLLDAMLPAARAVAGNVVAPKRFGAVFVPHGERPGFWTPDKVGTNFQPSTILQPLAPYVNHLTVVSQLCNPVAGHGVSVASWLSGSIPKRTVAEDVHAGKTIDQVIADKIGGDTVFKSLEVATEDFSGYIGGCDPAYACAYMNTLAWSSPTQPLPMEINPRNLFERMFGRPGTAAQRRERLATGRSILDSVKDDLARLERDVGPQDRSRLGDYLEHVRETEERIVRAEKQAAGDLEIPDAPVGIPSSFAAHVDLQFELISLALRTDLTRVFTFMMSRDVTQRTYPEIGITEPHHAMSHHGGNEEMKRNLVKLNVYHMTLFEKFVARLNKTPDGVGSMLDNTMVLWGSGMSESNNHERKDLPTLLVGGFGGRGSLHVATKPETPVANFMLTLGQHFGVEMDTFGISTGTVSI